MRFKASITVLVSLLAVAASADVKYTTEMQAAPGAPPIRSTVYVKGQQERRDTVMPGMGTEISTITQCARKQTVILNRQCKVYFVQEQGGAGEAPAAASEPGRQGGVVAVENDIRDTGEKQTMFGQQARHLVVKTTVDAKAGSCNPGRFEMENDVWMINLPGAQMECGRQPGEPALPLRGGCRDKYQISNRGSVTAFQGVPVKSAMTMVMPGGERHTTATEVKDFSTQALDASLFEVPADFKKVNSAQEVYACGMGMGAGAMQAQMAEAMKAAREQARRAEQQEAGAAPEGRAPTGKRAGILRIGVVATDQSGHVQPSMMAGNLVQEIATVDGFEGVRIEASDPAAIEKEAAVKSCDFLLYSNVVEAKSGIPKIGGLLGRATGRGGSVAPTQNIRVEYRLALVAPFDQQVARDTLSQSEQAANMDPVVASLAMKIAQRATTDARRWKQQNK